MLDMLFEYIGHNATLVLEGKFDG